MAPAPATANPAFEPMGAVRTVGRHGRTGDTRDVTLPQRPRPETAFVQPTSGYYETVPDYAEPMEPPVALDGELYVMSGGSPFGTTSTPQLQSTTGAYEEPYSLLRLHGGADVNV